VLIHSAAGGLGLAAVYLARHLGAEVYATAGSEEKRRYLRELGIKYVFSSRKTEFCAEILRLTDGRGVDVVLNSLTGNLAVSTLSLLARGGRFLEVGKRETLSHEAVLRLRPDAHHFVYDLGEEAALDASLVPALLQELLQALAKGDIPSLPVTEFTDTKEAFRFMAQARHVGKIVVTRKDAATLGKALRIDPDATYLITGGCGGLGLIFADWLVNRGARNLVLMGRSNTGVASGNIERMRAQGVSITLVTADVVDRSAVNAVLEVIPAGRPLRGILHAAGVISDHSLMELSLNSMKAVLEPKWQGAWNLHQLTRDCKLDFFVLFSSAAALLGSPGQANYAAANAALDALADYRQALGLPAVSIQWGPWNSVGMSGKWSADPERFGLERIGLGTIDPMDGLDAFESLSGGTKPVAAVLPVISWEKFVSRLPAESSSLFSLLTDTSIREEKAEALELIQRQQFHQALLLASAKDREGMLMEHLRQQTLRILSLPTQTRIDENEALHDLGLDSLMAVELRNALMSSLERQLSPTLVLDYPTLRTLTDFLLAEVSAVEEAPPEGQSLSESIGMLSEEEAEALLLEELGRRDLGARR
jgi:NADPH:quinone reductase-like Zn-dependent oxidoreductase/acyl carrier protein